MKKKKRNFTGANRGNGEKHPASVLSVPSCSNPVSNLSRDRIEALIETVELLGEPDFSEVLKEFESGRMKFRDIEGVEKELNGKRPRKNR